MFKSLSKKQWIIIGLILLIIILSIFLRPRPAAKTGSITADIPQFFKTTSSLSPALETDSQPVYPTSISTFKSLAINEAVVKTFFQPILATMNITTEPTTKNINDRAYLLWRDNGNYIDVVLSNGWFNLRTNQQPNQTLQPLIELDVQKIAENWLTNHNLLNDDFEVKTEYLTAGEQFGSSNDPKKADLFRFFITPKINQLPVFSPDESTPIIITFDNQGNLFSLNYQLPLTFFSQQKNIGSGTKKVKNSQQISAAASNNQAVISQIIYPENAIVSPQDQIQSARYKPGAIGYLASVNAPSLLPIIQLSGTITTHDNITTQVTAYLPALAD